jgi:alpha-beta hydrolase superfamily lysophospholipase
VVRTPFYFESRGDRLFGWLHRLESASRRDRGAIICPPIGHEQVYAHRSLRHLADAVAAAGFPVVRFDYHGTGDSAGSGEEPEGVATWLANIRDAHDWLRRRIGCEHISLIGLRIGATLATRAATEWPVDGLVLWAPVVKGRSYVREMKALSLTAAGGRTASEVPGAVEAAGFVLPGKVVLELGGLDLLQARPLCRRAAVFVRDDVAPDTHLLAHLSGLGIDAEQAALPGYADVMADPHEGKVPHLAIARIVAWLEAGSPDRARGRLEVVGDETPPDAALMSYTPPAEGPPVPEMQIRERVLSIRRDPDLFGILTEPPGPPREDLPMIVMLNGGSTYRVGPNRLHVGLARELASRGFRSLRMDLCGLGDSVSPDPGAENDPYPATAFRDVTLTLEHLRTRLGTSRVVLAGLCSGAYAAFQSAAQLTSPVLVESILINPLTFFWKEGISMEDSPALRIKTFQECMLSAWQPRKWLKLLSGRSKIGLAGAIGVLLRCSIRRGPAAPLGAGREDRPAGEYPSHPPRDDLPADLRRVASGGRHLSFFFSRSDPGYGLLDLYARRDVDALRRSGGLSLYFFDDADHTFTRRASRLALVRAITGHLARRYPRQPE